MSTYKEQIVNREEKEEVEIDLMELLSVIIGKLWMIVLAGLIFAMIAFTITKVLITPIYNSTTKVYVLNKEMVTDVGVTTGDLSASAQLTKDYQQLILSRTVLEQVIANQNLDMQYGQLARKVTVDTPVDTRVIAIIVADPDPKKAKDIADEMREVSAEHIQRVMDIESVNTVEDANLSVSPASPDVMKNTMIGGLLGIFLMIGIIVLIYILDDHMRTPDDIERYLNLSVLGIIPVMEKNKKTKKKNAESGEEIQKKE
ncbi:MAG: Wzz/FepE/Etk N-terminal domain-containing protein [Lachnospiraceae bacterium]